MKLSEKQFKMFISNRLDTKVNKYKNKKTYVGDILFDSKKEADRFLKLKLMEKTGIISDLQLQVPFLLIDTIKYNDKTYPKTKYIADFTYIKDNKLVVEDVKSEITRKDKTYRLKIKLLLSKYPDIIFKEIL